MCEMYVRVKDKINDNPYLDAQCLKRGDVVWVTEDGWNWGKDEKSDPSYRILRFSNISVSAGNTLLSQERITDPQNPSAVLMARAFKLDLDALSIDDYLQDDSRILPSIEINISESEFSQYKVAKQPLSNPMEL